MLLIVFSFPGQGRGRAGSVSWVEAVTPCRESCLAPFATEQNCLESIRELLLIPELSKGQVHALGNQLNVFPHLCAHKVMENLGDNCLLTFSSVSSETLMDTRTATAELGWTANPPSGVSATCPADPYGI